MKKIISILLLLALATMLLASCDMLMGGADNGDGGKDAASVGYFTSGEKSYFVTPDGTVEISGGAAKVVASAPEGTPESKKFDAPDTFAATFTTTTSGSGVAITGVSGADVVMVPRTIDGKEVLDIRSGAFNGVKTVIIGNLRDDDLRINISDGAFDGVKNVYIATVPTQFTVSYNTPMLLNNNKDLIIKISADEYSNFKTDYAWGKYTDNLKKY